MLIDIIPFVLASFGSLVLSYVTTASGGAASPGLGGQRTPRGKGKGKDMGITTSGLTRTSERAAGAFFWSKSDFFGAKSDFLGSKSDVF